MGSKLQSAAVLALACDLGCTRGKTRTRGILFESAQLSDGGLFNIPCVPVELSNEAECMGQGAGCANKLCMSGPTT